MSIENLLRGYEIAGLADLLGEEGPHTAFGCLRPEEDLFELHILPGEFTPEEVESLFRLARIGQA